MENFKGKHIIVDKPFLTFYSFNEMTGIVKIGKWLSMFKSIEENREISQTNVLTCKFVKMFNGKFVLRVEDDTICTRNDLEYIPYDVTGIEECYLLTDI